MERWDIYDGERRLTGRTMGKNEWILQDGEYHLTVLGVVRHIDGRFLITRRVLTKAWAAGWWEVPGGAVQAGESSREAVNREVWEETGLDVSGCCTWKRWQGRTTRRTPSPLRSAMRARPRPFYIRKAISDRGEAICFTI